MKQSTQSDLEANVHETDSEEGLFQFIYISRIRYSELFQYDVFQNISNVAKKNNKAKKITSVLCFGNGFFLQYAEGSEQALTNLKNRLLKDKRHQLFKICEFSKIDNRRFPDFHQGFVVFDKNYQDLNKDLKKFLPMTPHKWKLEKKIELIDIVKEDNLAKKEFKVASIDMFLMRVKLLIQLVGDNLNRENRIFWLSVLFLSTCLLTLILFVLISSSHDSSYLVLS